MARSKNNYSDGIFWKYAYLFLMPFSVILAMIATYYIISEINLFSNGFNNYNNSLVFILENSFFVLSTAGISMALLAGIRRIARMEIATQ